MTETTAQSYAEKLAAASPPAAAAFAVGTAAEPGERHAEIADLAQRAEAQLVHAPEEFRPHYALLANTTLCGLGIDRWLTSEQAARVSVLCKACETAAQDIAASREAQAAKDKAPVTDPQVHRFDSTGDAYGETQWNGEIRDGDVLVIESEGVVGILRRAWPAALTEQHGELHTLTAPAAEIDDAKYAASVATAAEAARQLGLALELMHTPAEAATGDRVTLPDGSAKTVTGTMRNGGKLWLLVGDGAAHRADRCERVDTSRVDEASATARSAALVLRDAQVAGEDAAAAAVRELGEALRYLAQAAPEELAAMAAESTRRLVVEVPRLAVVPGDVLRAFGVRLDVLDVGVSTATEPQWWARVHGVDESDRRATYRAPWNVGMGAGYAAWDLVTVERIAPAYPF
ncbi:hypothetical protein [Streptomyces sulphureus]|uniref:hypothetical protein n=1 Tax=Streptomyces sulphureus TaxID=47758 RepID=UPI0003607E65|nr:hypothetical protein [Streptomyces sulphureus]